MSNIEIVFYEMLFSIKKELNLHFLLINQKLHKMSQVLDDLTAKVEAETTVNQSAITLIQTIKSELDAAIASGDQAALQTLSDKIGANTDALAAAVTANTPAE